MNNKKVVIFDWGGVLMRTEDQTPRHAWDQRLGLAAGSVERVVHGHQAWHDIQIGKIDDAQYWQSISTELGLSPEMANALRSEFYNGDRLDTGLVATIRDLRARGVKIGLLSNNTLSLLDEIDALGVRDLFDVIIISAGIGVMKPDAVAYRAILDQMGVQPQHAAFIDDFAENVAGARNIGMHGIHFNPENDLGMTLKEWLNDSK
jgi:epoxide hydrolase-like predicted phosphatase